MNAQRVCSRRQVMIGSAGIAAGALVPGLFNPRQASATVDIYLVNAGGLRVRSGPGTSYRVLTTLAVGTAVEVISWNGWANGYEWAQVWISSTDLTGYVATTYLSPWSYSGTFEVGSLVHVKTASGGGANLRSQPDITASVIRVVANGTTGEVLSGSVASNGYEWVRVAISGSTGWMATSVLAAGAGTSSRPMVKVINGPLNVRLTPGLTGTILITAPTGATGEVTEHVPVTKDGYVWVNVHFFNQANTTGWVARKYLAYV